MNNFKTTIGLEIHVELNTKRKMFCDCQNPASLNSSISEREPNSFCCPTCMGFPGTLPRANKKAIDYAIMAGFALGSDIQKLSKFDRKHYFYPDLPKGYQISQYDQPFCKNGSLEVDGNTIRINRVHLEEDAGKLIHPEGENYSLVDLNRAGTPLIEIVTEPDISSPKQASSFVKKLRTILKHIGISNADMEKGHLRCDANIDVKYIGDGSNKMSPIVEIKNLNSFRFIEQALSYEENRLKKEINNWPEKRTKQTRGFDSKRGITYEQRLKEEASDYRYFPEPDLPVFVFNDEYINDLKNKMPKTLDEVSADLERLNLNKEQVSVLSKNKNLFKFFEKVLHDFKDAKFVYTWVVVEALSIAKKQKKPLEEAFNYDQFMLLLKALKEGKINPAKAKSLLVNISENKEIEKDLQDEVVEIDYSKIIKEVIDKNQSAVEDYKKGKTNAVAFLIGQVMAVTKGQADPKISQQEIIKSLENKK